MVLINSDSIDRKYEHIEQPWSEQSTTDLEQVKHEVVKFSYDQNSSCRRAKS